MELSLIACRTESVPTGLRIFPGSDQAMVVDPAFYTLPIRIDAHLEIEGMAQGLRLLFAAGEVIFGEGGSESLCFVDPLTGAYQRIPGQGRLPQGRVRIQFELTAEGVRILVNGEERFAQAGSYPAHLSSQVGLGIPAKAEVTLGALTVGAEQSTLGHRVQAHVPLDFDGGVIDVLYDHHPQVLAWYTEVLGLKGHSWHGPTDPEADATLFSTLSLPDHGAFHLYSVLTRKRLAHWYSERGTVDGDVRFCLQSPNLARTHAYLAERGVRHSAIAVGPEGREFFDFYAPEGTRLTAVAYPEQAEAYPEAHFTNFAPPRIGVTDLQRSAAWYQELLGARVEKAEEGYFSLNAWFILEAVPAGAHLGQVDGAARPYFVCRSRQQFTQLYERLREAGARPSGYMNPPGTRWSAFHFYDPDGNRLNVWSYY